MKTFSIRSLGCTVNHYESQQIRQALEHLRLAPIGVGQDPDLVVVNTCCVTAKASVKSRLSLIASRRVCPTGDDDTPSSPDSLIRPNTGLQIKPKDGNSPQTLPTLSRFEGQTRALLKVQEGCDGRCAFCIVPQTRPIMSSKSLRAAVAEAQTLVRSGHQEIVITGVYLGAYGQQTVLQKEWPQGRYTHHIQPGPSSPHNRYPRRFPRGDGVPISTRDAL